jgi:hypothetical protein
MSTPLKKIPDDVIADAIDRGLLPDLVGYQIRLAQVAIFRESKRIWRKQFTSIAPP